MKKSNRSGYTSINQKEFDNIKLLQKAGLRHGQACRVTKRAEGTIRRIYQSETLEEYKKLTTRVVDLHPITCMQNARTSAGGVVTGIPSQALTVGPVQTWQAEKVSIWQAGVHDNPFGQRLTALMIGKKIIDSAVPMSLLADHPNVQFNYYRGGLGTCGTEMH